MQDQGGHDKRQKKLAEVVTLCRRHLLADKNFTDEAVIRQFPELMPELADELKRVRRIDQARRQADALMGSPPDPPSPGTPVDGALSETLAETGSVPDAPGPGSQVRFFGDYELLEEIDRGGMGIVYKARQISLDKLVALKMILAGRFATQEDVRRFHTEARAAANLKHPHIVPVHEVGEQEGQLYFSMDYIEGQDLHEAISEHPLPPRKAAAYVAIVARAIAYAHTQGVLHRDLKPSNILIDKNDQPWITDFGLAKRAEGDSQLTATGQVLGTPEYIPPEQAQGDRQHIGPRSDVYSLGAVLYTLITGDPPFQGENVTATLLQVIHNQPVPIRKVIRSVDRDLDTICLKCLEKQPSSRYGTADELADELERYLQHRPILARPVSRPERAWRWCKRNPLVASLAGLVILLLAALLIKPPIPPMPTPPPPVAERPEGGDDATSRSPAKKSTTPEEEKEEENWLKGPVEAPGGLSDDQLDVWKPTPKSNAKPNPKPNGKPNAKPNAKPTPKPNAKRKAQAPAPPPLAIAPFDADQAERHQQAWAKHLDQPVALTNNIDMKLVLIPPGEFLMGSPDTEAGRQAEEGPPCRVRITQPFYLGVDEVMQAEYEVVMGKNPSEFQVANHPVEKVSWEDAVEFCERLSKREGETYRLPTEAEWEYACRAGSPTAYSFGDDPAALDQYAWYANNSGNSVLDAIQLWKTGPENYNRRLAANGCQTHPVGNKPPNAWGLHDMHGNVYEWCQDWFGQDWFDPRYGSGPLREDPTGPAKGSQRVLRGGSWMHDARDCRSAVRYRYWPNNRLSHLGFRVVLVRAGE